MHLSKAGGDHMHTMHYHHLLFMVVLSFISMYLLMYAMVDSFANVFMSFNQFYMAGLMIAPMVIIEIVVMGAVYANKRLNMIIIAGSLIVLAALFFFIRQQTLIGDAQFLRSMIPHHAGAVLMCQKASIQDREIKELCRTIILGQQAEIDQMKAKLDGLDR
ncbi:MAG: DUF305 domain-containing protein [Alphaproteobacteria bacterium]|jgi:hypothetical protein